MRGTRSPSDGGRWAVVPRLPPAFVFCTAGTEEDQLRCSDDDRDDDLPCIASSSDFDEHLVEADVADDPPTDNPVSISGRAEEACEESFCPRGVVRDE